MSIEAKQTPLVDLLRGIPKDARWVHDEYDAEGRSVSTQFVPVGRMMHEAADEIDRLRAAIPKVSAPLLTDVEIDALRYDPDAPDGLRNFARAIERRVMGETP